jgi:hypothetical protein
MDDMCAFGKDGTPVGGMKVFKGVRKGHSCCFYHTIPHHLAHTLPPLTYRISPTRCLKTAPQPRLLKLRRKAAANSQRTRLKTAANHRDHSLA